MEPTSTPGLYIDYARHRITRDFRTDKRNDSDLRFWLTAAAELCSAYGFIGYGRRIRGVMQKPVSALVAQRTLNDALDDLSQSASPNAGDVYRELLWIRDEMMLGQ